MQAAGKTTHIISISNIFTGMVTLGSISNIVDIILLTFRLHSWLVNLNSPKIVPGMKYSSHWRESSLKSSCQKNTFNFGAHRVRGHPYKVHLLKFFNHWWPMFVKNIECFFTIVWEMHGLRRQIAGLEMGWYLKKNRQRLQKSPCWKKYQTHQASFL